MAELDASLAKALVMGVALRNRNGLFTDLDVGGEVLRACGLTIVPSAINRILGAVPHCTLVGSRKNVHGVPETLWRHALVVYAWA